MTQIKEYIREVVSLSLREDIESGDITAQLVPNKIARANIISRQKAIVCGKNVVNEVFQQLDKKVTIDWKINDGDEVTNEQILCSLQGPARSLLTGERTALNFLQTLSSTATLTKTFVAQLKGTNAKLLDTRKTLPGLRLLQKYAVTCGGGHNHRFGLYDAVLIKENHIAACGSIINAINKAKNLYPHKTIEIEVRNLNEFTEALQTATNIIMLDNFNLSEAKQAVKIAKSQKNAPKIEFSGGVTLKTIHAIAKTGVDFISVGAITKTIVPIELSMLFYN